MTICPSSLDTFLLFSPPEMRQAMLVLAAAPVLTDKVAMELYSLAPVEGLSPESFVAMIRMCDFVVERNSEWVLQPDSRRWLLQGLIADSSKMPEAHRRLLAIRNEYLNKPEYKCSIIPGYLYEPAGLAYHTSFFSEEEGLKHYADGYNPSLSGQQWLLGVLAEEQQRAGFLSPSAIEPKFLRGMTLWKEGDYKRAFPLLQMVADSGQARVEVAIAMHLIALHIGQRDYSKALGYLEQSRELGEQLKLPHHLAQVLHSLGKHIGQRDYSKALGYLEQSLKLEKDFGSHHGQAQVLHSLGKHIGQRDYSKALGYLEQSLKLLNDIGDTHGLAQVLHSLGKHIGQRDFSKALGYLEQSLKLLNDIGDTHGQAQVLNSIGNLFLRNEEMQSASKAFNSALSISHERKANLISRLGLSKVAENLGNLESAIKYLIEVVELQRTIGPRKEVERHEKRLSILMQESAKRGR